MEPAGLNKLWAVADSLEFDINVGPNGVLSGGIIRSVNLEGVSFDVALEIEASKVFGSNTVLLARGSGDLGMLISTAGAVDNKALLAVVDMAKVHKPVTEIFDTSTSIAEAARSFAGAVTATYYKDRNDRWHEHK
jgi:hypothetical protein